MKKWYSYLPAYIPPLAILVFLLLTNLFTRSRVLRSFLFPERSIVISTVKDDDFSDIGTVVFLNDTSNSPDEDTIGCSDSAYQGARALFIDKNYSAAIAEWSALLNSTQCNKSNILNSMGIAYLKTAKIHTALQTFERATHADSSNARSWYNLGLCRSKKGLFREAVAAYSQAITLNPSMNKAHFNLGVLALQQNKFKEARKHFSTALEWGADKAVCRYNRALAYQRQDSTQQAIREYYECIRFAPKQTAARLRLAELYEKTGNIDSALIVSQQTIEINPGNPEMLIRLAKIEITGKLFDDAITTLDRADKIRQGLSEASYQRARIFGLRGDNKRALHLYRSIMAHDPSNPRVYYNIGINLMDLGMDREAIDAYARSLKADPTYWRSAYNLGVYYLKINLPLEAAPFFRRVVEVTPERAQAHYNLGLAYFKAGKLNDAQSSFMQSIQLDSTYIEGRYNLALTLMKNGENDSAKAVFESVLPLSPCHAKTYYNLGLLFRRSGDYYKADSCYLQAISCKQSSYPSAWYSRALCKKDLGQLDSALWCVQKATIPNDSETISAKALLLEARLYDTLGFTDSVDRTLKRADSLCGNDPEALQELAEFYTKRGATDRSLHIYRHILRTDTMNIDLLLSAAAIESKAGNPDSAEMLYKKAIAIDNSNIDIYKEYAQLLVRLHHNEDALRVLQNALYLDPASAEVRLETALIYAGEKRTTDYNREIAKLRKIPMSSSEALSVGKKLHRVHLCTDAVWFLRNAAETSSEKPDGRYLLLECQESTGSNKFNSLQEWTAFVHDFPHFGKGYVHLARAYMKKGLWENAQPYLDTALTLEESSEARLALIEICLKRGDTPCVEEQKSLYLTNNPEERKRKELYALLSSK